MEKENGERLTNQQDILNEVTNFYTKLYEAKETEDVNLNNILSNHPKISEVDKEKLEGPITYTEAANTLKNMKNNKSPGPDGFTNEFYKFFFKDIGHYYIRSLNEGFKMGQLTTTQYQGVITCLPKEGKPKQYIKNWRPISLLNVSYKILSACIALRLQKVLPKIIHESQKGFIKGRYIGENIRMLYDVLVHAENENIPGLILMIDFEKAFDSVSWNFIEKALIFFNFPNSTVKWFHTLYKGANSCISFNGQYSKWFNLKRGCRQGDPISLYLYLICAEILSLMIRQNRDIKGIKMKEENALISLFADDTTLYLDGDEKSFREAILTLDKFTLISGLKINSEKTQIVWIGNNRRCGREYMRDRNFVWDPGTFKVLGITFSTQTNTIPNINFKGKLEEAKRDPSRWNKRHLTPFGKITIIKTLIISKLNYLFLNIPDPTNEFIKQLEKILYEFLLGGKVNRIKKANVIKSYEQSGLKMSDINSIISALKLSWLRRIQNLHKKELISLSLYPELN